MRKILLIEDRIERQQEFINSTKIAIDSYDILDNMANNYEKIFTQLKEDNFKFSNYSVIISHESAFGDENVSIIEKLKKYCKNEKKTLVLFSGGIDANYYLKEEGYEFIKLSSKTLYSHNLKIFLDDVASGNLHPLILCYGGRWKINILLNILEKLNIYMRSIEKEEVRMKYFLRDNKDVELIKTLSIEKISLDTEMKKITKIEIEKFRDNILEYIEQEV